MAADDEALDERTAPISRPHFQAVRPACQTSGLD